MKPGHLRHLNKNWLTIFKVLLRIFLLNKMKRKRQMHSYLLQLRSTMAIACLIAIETFHNTCWIIAIGF